MRLDLTPLDDAIAQLEEALEFHGSDLASRDPALKLHLRAAAIQAFEFTYELSFKMLKRHLEQASENPDRFDQASFSEIMREASGADWCSPSCPSGRHTGSNEA